MFDRLGLFLFHPNHLMRMCPTPIGPLTSRQSSVWPSCGEGLDCKKVSSCICLRPWNLPILSHTTPVLVRYLLCRQAGALQVPWRTQKPGTMAQPFLTFAARSSCGPDCRRPEIHCRDWSFIGELVQCHLRGFEHFLRSWRFAREACIAHVFNKFIPSLFGLRNIDNSDGFNSRNFPYVFSINRELAILFSVASCKWLQDHISL